MDYAVGFIVGFICKEVYRVLKYISASETIIIDKDFDEEWDWISRPEDLP